MQGIRSKADLVFDGVVHLFLLVAGIITVYPFLYVLFASFSDSYLMSTHSGPLFWFLDFSLDAYRSVLKNSAIWTGYRNTLFYVVLGVSINMGLTILGGYALSRRNMRFRSVIMFAIVFTMIFKGGMIPNYILVRQMGLYDTVWAIVLPSAINTMNLVIMRTAFAAMPDALEESAKIDGAGDFTILLRIALPVTLSTILTLTLYYAVTRWNAWFSAFIYIRTRSKLPLQNILREILIEGSMGELTDGASASDVYRAASYKYCTIIVSTLPMMLVFPFIQRFFGKGVMVGAIKG